MGANLGKTTKFCSKHTFWGKVAENQDFIKEKSTKLAGLVGKCFGSVFATVLCTVGDGKSQKLGSRRNHQKWRVFFKIEFFSVTKSGGLEIYSEQNPLF